MTIYDRARGTEPEVREWDGGLTWIAHPEETGRRASHAVRGEDGVWVLDPVDAEDIDGRIQEVGEVVGVAVCSNWHARDADVFARRHDLAVHLPEWMDRVEPRVDAPVERYATAPGESGFEVRHWEPVPGWREAIFEYEGTLVVPESLGTADPYTVGGERVGVPVSVRLRPPRAPLSGIAPDRVLVGHGAGVFENADDALRDALDGARRRFPRALLSNGATQFRSLVAALRD